MTVTATVTDTASYYAVLSASGTSSVETSMANSTSIFIYEHHTHRHPHTSPSAPRVVSSTTMAAASSNTSRPSSASSPTSSTAINATSSADQKGSLLTQITTSLAPTTFRPLQTFNSTSSAHDCQQDNCFRDFIRQPGVAGFCANYTRQINTVATELPYLFSQCNHNPSSILSACSCMATAVPTFIPAQPANDCLHDSCLRHFIRHPEATGFYATYTKELNTATTGLADLVYQCQYNPTRISSACSCIVTGNWSPSRIAQATTINNGIYTTATSSGPSPKITSNLN